MLLLQILLLFMSAVDYCRGNRTKRVLKGLRVLGRKGPYDAVRYLVGYGSVHGMPWYTFGFLSDFLKYYGIYGHINCSGALLTPSVIQTACHCLATFSTDPFPRTAVDHNWEGLKVVYIGINDRFGEPFSMQTRPPATTKRFFVHKRCQKLPRRQGGFSYDFGYVAIDPSWIGGKIGVPTTSVDFAPTYESQELIKILHLYKKTPPVCLNMGFGDIDDYGTPTDFIRAGWSQMSDEHSCRYYTCYNLTSRQIDTYKSWVCTEEFPIYYLPIRKGDSGSPVTCDNVYFAIASAIIPIHILNDHTVGIHQPIVFAERQNAVEYRQAFEQEVKKWVEDGDRDRVRNLVQNVVQVRRISDVKHHKPTSTKWIAEEVNGIEQSLSNTVDLSDPALLLMALAVSLAS